MSKRKILAFGSLTLGMGILSAVLALSGEPAMAAGGCSNRMATALQSIDMCALSASNCLIVTCPAY
jgi:hypothetical protein